MSRKYLGNNIQNIQNVYRKKLCMVYLGRRVVLVDVPYRGKSTQMAFVFLSMYFLPLRY